VEKGSIKEERKGDPKREPSRDGEARFIGRTSPRGSVRYSLLSDGKKKASALGHCCSTEKKKGLEGRRYRERYNRQDSDRQASTEKGEKSESQAKTGTTASRGNNMH